MKNSERFTRRHKDRCQESAIHQRQGNLRLERDADGNPTGIVRGLRVLNKTSKNRRMFQAQAHKDVVRQINDGTLRVNLNHTKSKSDDYTPPEPDVLNRFGRLFDAKFDQKGHFTESDMKYNPKHGWAKAFEWFVENDPEAIGLSVDGIFRGPILDNGVRSVESIPKLFSIDIVSDPGSTNSLFEEENMDENAEDDGVDLGASLDMNDLQMGEDKSNESAEHLCNLIKALIAEGKLDTHAVMDAINNMANGSKGEEVDEDAESEDDADDKEKPKDELSDDKPKESPMAETKDTKSEVGKGAESIETLTEELNKLRLEVDTYRANEARNNTVKEAKSFCEKADLHEVLITDVLIDHMVTRGKEHWEKIVSDRKLQVGDTETRSSGRGEGAGPSLDEFVKSLGAKS